MNYPIWELTKWGGGSLIALVAITHVYVSHLAVGGGLFIWLTDWKAYKTNDTILNDFLRRYNWVFLLVTMVFGGVSGVGIWWTIALVSPAGTSALIHSFVFGWAIEWVFFIGEIAALLAYHYYFDKLSRKNRLVMAFLYALFAWLSLFIINGILSFMLTPGKWLVTHGFWDGFLNPGYFASLFFRTFITVMTAGIFAFVVGAWQKEDATRFKVSRLGVKWLLVGFIGMVPTGFWYLMTTPADVRFTAFKMNPESVSYVGGFTAITPLILIAGLLFLLKGQAKVSKALAIVIAICGLLWMGGFEYMREIARKPYIIQNYMYSNGMLVDQVAEYNRRGILPDAVWATPVKGGEKDRLGIVGRDLLYMQCMSCHTLGGPNDLLVRTKDFTYMGMQASLAGQGKVRTFMPPYVGTNAERDVLAAYIVRDLHGKEVVAKPPTHKPPESSDELPKFKDNNEYVLMAWNDLGMHCISDCDPYLVILPPANTIEAQLIKRGDPPEILTEGIKLTYSAPAQNMNPSQHSKFWNFSKSNFGVELENNVGLAGKGLTGELDLEEGRNHFIAHLIPVVPYPDGGGFNPYPLFTVQAHDEETGELLAETGFITPTSTEMGCLNCHGGPWSTNYGAGVSGETASNILTAHDRLNGTTLYEDAMAGNPRLCQSCHPDPAVGAEGVDGVLSLSAALHGWHANYMHLEGMNACVMCHPSYPGGVTRCLRGVHDQLDIGCTQCHGELPEHAFALLKQEEEKPSAGRLMANLEITHAESKEAVNPRIPWLQEPDCMTCHIDYEKPDHATNAYNEWVDGFDDLFRRRTGMAEIRCEACHGSPHALYPAQDNPYGKNLDNIQPYQYGGEPWPIGSNGNCKVCHTAKMDEAIHHENMNRPVRGAFLKK